MPKKETWKFSLPSLECERRNTQDGGSLGKVYLDDNLMTNHPELLWFGLHGCGEGHQLVCP